jgi:hypothetical protein
MVTYLALLQERVKTPIKHSEEVTINLGQLG